MRARAWGTSLPFSCRPGKDWSQQCGLHRFPARSPHCDTGKVQCANLVQCIILNTSLVLSELLQGVERVSELQ